MVFIIKTIKVAISRVIGIIRVIFIIIIKIVMD